MVANKKGHDSPTLLVRSVCDDTKRVETIGEGPGMGGGFGPRAAAVGSVILKNLVQSMNWDAAVATRSIAAQEMRGEGTLPCHRTFRRWEEVSSQDRLREEASW